MEKSLYWYIGSLHILDILQTLAQVFSCEFCEISESTFFTEHIWATASENLIFTIFQLRKHFKPFCPILSYFSKFRPANSDPVLYNSKHLSSFLDIVSSLLEDKDLGLVYLQAVFVSLIKSLFVITVRLIALNRCHFFSVILLYLVIETPNLVCVGF